MKTKMILLIAGILLTVGGTYAQAPPGDDLQAVCSNAMSAPSDPVDQRPALCATISAQVAASAPPGVTLSCTWTGSDCVATIVVDESVRQPGTGSTNLRAACANGNTYEDLCNNISNAITSSGQAPEGITVQCVWNNPGAHNMCSPRITLDTSEITEEMVGTGLVKSMQFFQAGSLTSSVRVVADPFLPYVIHVVINGSLLPGGRDSDTWMTVTNTSDITPQTFDFDSIDPAAMAESEKTRLLNQFSSGDDVEIGEGVGPDFSILKTFQTFNWSMTLSYDTSREYAGAMQCNGTYNATVDQCMSGNQTAQWITLTECTTPASCPSGSYRKDVPSVGYLTIYDADPVPLYMLEETTTTTTTVSSTTTSSVTTTTSGGCELVGDGAPCGAVTLAEVVSLINLWSNGQATLPQVIALINVWAGA